MGKTGRIITAEAMRTLAKDKNLQTITEYIQDCATGGRTSCRCYIRANVPPVTQKHLALLGYKVTDKETYILIQW